MRPLRIIAVTMVSTAALLGTGYNVGRVAVTEVRDDNFPTGDMHAVCSANVAAYRVIPADISRGCDYRGTGWPCEEDEVCALAEINETGGYKS